MRALKEHRRALTVIIVLALASPIFGVFLSELVGYHEPLDLAAELLGLEELTEKITWTPLADYTVPGLPDWLGYAVSGLLGAALVLALGYLFLKLLK
ncbi:MAG: PDGLE domain-containing protein [Thermofilaceae archaeon]